MTHHIETAHTKEFKYSCNECNHVSNRKDNMKRHIETAHNVDSLNQTWVKRKPLHETIVRGKRENDVDGNLDKTWLPNNIDDDETI